MMALNIAVPLATVGDLMDGFGLLSPISPLSVDCRGVAATGSLGKKQLVSPVGSESSGVSSLDSDEIKKPTTPPSTPTEEVEEPRSTSPLALTTTVQSESVIGQDSSAKSPATSSSCSSTRSSLSSADSIACSGTEDSSSASSAIDETLAAGVSVKEIKVILGGRDVLNLIDNLTTPSHFRLQFAQLPENDNIHFFLDNRSQYHRLGANGHIQEYTMVKCNCCDFRYPVNGTSMTSSGQAEGAGRNAIISAFQQMQQQQQHQHVQWNIFANNFNSIANNRDKLSLNVAPNAFNKTFGGGNSSNNNNSSNSNNSNSGSQYFRGNNMVANLFGRDSNRNSFLNSTSTYNNHKSYQQNFGASNNNNSKFNASYGGSYPVQQPSQQQFYSKNHQIRYGNGSGNNNANTQSNSSGTFNTTAAVAAAAALASQNLLNFNNFNSSPSSYTNKNNNNNMFAYYKTMM